MEAKKVQVAWEHFRVHETGEVEKLGPVDTGPHREWKHIGFPQDLLRFGLPFTGRTLCGNTQTFTRIATPAILRESGHCPDCLRICKAGGW